MHFPPLTWFDLGALIGVCLSSLAVIVGIAGYLTDVLTVRRRKLVLAEAREMVRMLENRRVSNELEEKKPSGGDRGEI